MTGLKTLAIGLVIGLSAPALVWGDSMSSSKSWVFYGGPRGNTIVPSGSPGFFDSHRNASTAATAPVSAPAPVSVSVAPVSAADHSSSAVATTYSAPAAPNTGTADAYINLGTSAAPEASTLTTGGAQPWYDSPAVEKVYGGNVPTASQQASFANMVLSDVKQTFNEAGLNPSLTLSPSVAANHTLSVVSNTSYGANPNAIGITDVGHNGFSFIDKLNFANSPEQLANVVAKNISHELMHAFGVGTHPDTTGNYIDAGTASWSLLTNPDSTFSPAAVALINKTGFGNNANGTSGAQMIDGEQEVTPVPEPSTVALWTIGGLAGIVAQRRRTSNKKAA